MSVVGAVLTGALITWAWVASRLWRGQALLPYEPRRLVPWSGVDLLLIVAVYLLAQVIAQTAAARWAGLPQLAEGEKFDARATFVLLAAHLVGNLITLTIALCLLVLRAGASLRDLGIEAARIAADLKCGVVAFLAAGPLVYAVQALVVQWIPYEHPLVDAMQKQPAAATLWVVSLSAVVVAPLFEEFIFRVILQGWLEKLETALVLRARGLRLPVGIAAGSATTGQSFPESSPSDNPYQPPHADITIGASDEPREEAVATAIDVHDGPLGLPLGLLPILSTSLLFAGIHFGQGPAPIPLFLLSLVLGYLYQRTHRVLPSLVVHALLNGVSVLMLWLAPHVQP